MNINLIYIKLRKTQTAVLKLNDDGTYTILVNSDKPIDVQRKGILHEIGHILNDDMYSLTHTLICWNAWLMQGNLTM